MKSDIIKKFRKKHNCKSCLCHTKMKRCLAELVCPLDEDDKTKLTRKSCPLDEDGTCPYKNEVGTCFGFCMKKVVKEHEERKQNYVQTKEEKENG